MEMQDSVEIGHHIQINQEQQVEEEQEPRQHIMEPILD